MSVELTVTERPRRKRAPTGKPATSRKKKGKGPRKGYTPPVKLRAAFLAGRGRSAGNIAKVLGNTTPQQVYSLVKSLGLEFVPKNPHESADVFVCRSRVLQLLEKAATDNGVSPAILFGKVLELAQGTPMVEEALHLITGRSS